MDAAVPSRAGTGEASPGVEAEAGVHPAAHVQAEARIAADDEAARWPCWDEVVAAAEGAGKQHPAEDALLGEAAPPLTSWQKFESGNGQGCWYWREDTEDWFLEDDPGPWRKFLDPDQEKAYWWKDDDSDWFWDSFGEVRSSDAAGAEDDGMIDL